MPDEQAQQPEAAAGPRTHGRLSANELDLFNRQLIAASRAGAPLVPALEALGRELRTSRLKVVIDEMIRDMQSGCSLAEAVGRRGEAFPPLYEAMLRAAAESGDLHGMMDMVNQLTASSADLKRRMTAAMTYPTILLAAAAGVLLYFILVPMSGFEEVISGLEEVWLMPALFAAGRYIGLAFVGAVALVAAGLLLLSLVPPGRRAIGRLAMRLPLYGPLLQARRSFVFCRTLGLLLAGGVPMRRALDVVRETVGGSRMKRSIAQVQRELESGARLAEAMENAGGFQPTLVWAVGAAEARGELPEGLIDASDFFRENAEHRGLFMVQVLPAAVIVVVAIVTMFAAYPLFQTIVALTRFLSLAQGI